MTVTRIASPHGWIFSVRCTRGSDGPVERTGGYARGQVYQALQGKAPFGAREAACTTHNGVDFHDTVDTGRVCWFSLSGNRSEDAVSIGRGEVKGAGCGIVRKVHSKVPSHCKSAEVGWRLPLPSRSPRVSRGEVPGIRRSPVPVMNRGKVPASVPPPGRRAPLSKTVRPLAHRCCFS